MKRIYKTVGILLLTLIVAGSLSGCFLNFFRGGGSNVQFDRDKLVVAVKDVVDLSDYLKSPSDKKDVEFASADSSIASISGSELHAVRTGTVSVTASLGTKSDEMLINVAYNEVSGIGLAADGSLYMYVGEIRPVTFTATPNEGADPETAFSWYVDGVYQRGSGPEFIYTPADKAGVTTVSARYGNIESRAEINVFRPFEIPDFVASGEMVQKNGPEKISFELPAFAPEAGDAHIKVEWLANGERFALYYDEYKADYTPPEAGEYLITCLVNEREVSFAGGDAKLVVHGEKKIKDLLFDFDSSYPNLTLSWQPIGDETAYEVEISGKTYTSDAYPKLFTAHSFDASGKADLTRDLTFTVKFLGGGIYAPTTATLTHAALRTEAVSYLNKSYFNGNYYISDEAEFIDLFAYAMVFRPESTATVYAFKQCRQVEYRVYMGYDSALKPRALVNKAWEYASQTGSYYLDASGQTGKNGVVKVKIIFASVNEPDNFSVSGKTTYLTLQPPHLGTGSGEFTLGITERPLASSPVSTSEELYYVVNAGYRPNLKADSSAETLYNQAVGILRGILDEGMSETEVAHAVFDYVMWKVSYDFTVAGETSIETAVRQPAFYLEGVLTTGFAVCDGMAKTYSLLCNMAGLRCVRVVGQAFSGGQMGDHAWNKVFVEGSWYIVDPTWSDFQASVGGKVFEAASHQYFLVTDRNVATNHFEDNPAKYPATAATPLFVAPRLSSLSAADDELYALIKARADDKTYDYSVLGKSYSSLYRVLELSATDKVAEYLTKNNYSAVSRTLAKAGVRMLNYEVIEYDGTFMILLK